MTNGIVIVNRHEPNHEVAARLLEIAEAKGHDPRVVEAQRGEHDTDLSFRVPQDVADEFETDRADRWPDKIENDSEKADNRPVAALNEDAVAADGTRTATDQAVTTAQTEQTDTAQDRSARPGKAKAKE